MAARKGVITFGLVSVPVELHVAARSTSLDFDMLHGKDMGRIQYRLWCAEEDAEVPRKETVKAFKLGDQYVVMDDEDFEKAERATSRTIDVQHFVDLSKVDPVYLERSYWVGPQADTERAYGVLLAAMRNTNRGAVVTFVMGRRQQYALLRPDGERFALHTLYYGDEVRVPEADWKAGKPDPREVKIAQEFIEALSGDFTPEKYEDEYRKTLLAVIQAKAEGQEPALPAAPKAPAKVHNLMDALQASIDAVRKPLAKTPGKADARPAEARGRGRSARPAARRRAPRTAA